jgi:L-2-hydroxyglutarate oxidase LhgO
MTDPRSCGVVVRAYVFLLSRLSPAADFVITGQADTSVPGYVALYGIESPGLTASLAIANKVVRLLAGKDLDS